MSRSRLIAVRAVAAPGPGERARIDQLLAEAEAADGRAPLNDQLRADFDDGLRRATGLVAEVSPDAPPVGYAQLSGGRGDPSAFSLGVATDPSERRPGVAAVLVRAALDCVSRRGGGTVHWWVFTPGAQDGVARRLGFAVGRELARMARPLPHPGTPNWPAGVSVRAFRPGADDEAWLAVNNRAFAGHPEQGGWTGADLAVREREPWFDPGGFLVAETAAPSGPARMVGFCWTKLHGCAGRPGVPGHRHPAPFGEIYVVGVDPSARGTGLGRALVLAGLERLTAVGATTALLYVDAGNAAAVGLYRSLGFVTDHVDRAYVATVPAATS